MQMFDVYDNKAAYEDRVAQLKKDYDTPKDRINRKPLKTIVKQLFKRN